MRVWFHRIVVMKHGTRFKGITSRNCSIRSFMVRDTVKSGRIKYKRKSDGAFNQAERVKEGRGKKKKKNENVTDIVGDKTWSHVDWFVYWTPVSPDFDFVQLSNTIARFWYPFSWLQTFLFAVTSIVYRNELLFCRSIKMAVRWNWTFAMLCSFDENMWIKILWLF